MNRGEAHPQTIRWREILKRKEHSPARDLSPMPESIPTAYSRPRFEEERLAEKEKLAEQRAQKRAAEGKEPSRKNAECRMSKTTYPMNAGHFNQLFFERDVLLDKVKRRSDEVKKLRAKVVELGGAAESSDDDSSSSSSSSCDIDADSPSGSNVPVLPASALNG